MTDHATTQSITKIVYSFKDSSVPPQYHRSYTITVTSGQAHIVVDSYGEILADATIDIPEQKLSDLARYIEIFQIKQRDHRSDTTKWIGGASKSLKVYSGDNILLEGVVYQHGDHSEGTLSGDIDSFTKLLEDLIPNFPNLLK